MRGPALLCLDGHRTGEHAERQRNCGTGSSPERHATTRIASIDPIIYAAKTEHAAEHAAEHRAPTNANPHARNHHPHLADATKQTMHDDTSTQDVHLRALIDALEAARDRVTETRSEDDYRSVLQELGYTDQDFDTLDAHINTLHTRGLNFLNNGVWNRASRELEDALRLAPWRADIAFELAKAQLSRARATAETVHHRRSAAQTCIQLCEKVLVLVPEHPDAARTLHDAEEILLATREKSSNHHRDLQRRRHAMATKVTVYGGVLAGLGVLGAAITPTAVAGLLFGPIVAIGLLIAGFGVYRRTPAP